MAKIVIFDLDGCLADDRHRRHYLPDMHAARAAPLAQSDFDAYHAPMSADPAMNIEVVEEAAKAGCHVAFVTARPEKYEHVTLHWIHQHMPFLDLFSLHMRPEGDDRHSPELKVDLINQDVDLEWAEIEFAYDDRMDVLRAYAEQCKVAQLYQMDHEGPKLATIVTTLKAGWVADGILSESPLQSRNWTISGEINQSDGPSLDEQLAGIKAFLKPEDAAQVLEDMASTFRERNAVYGDNWRQVAPLMRALFPDGLPDPAIVFTDQWHLFELMLVKLTRFANSGLKHVDSIHDTAVYAAMIEYILRTEDGE